MEIDWPGVGFTYKDPVTLTGSERAFADRDPAGWAECQLEEAMYHDALLFESVRMCQHPDSPVRPFSREFFILLAFSVLRDRARLLNELVRVHALMPYHTLPKKEK